MKNRIRSRSVWAALAAASIGCGALAWKLFPLAFPVVGLDIRMTRSEAMRAAGELEKRLGLGPEGYRQAASFEGDDEVQNYVELEGGGARGFARFLKDGLYLPYQWNVRHFREGERLETRFSFTPEGEIYGFSRQLPEEQKGAALPEGRARAIAEREARDAWKVDLRAYKLAESARDERPGGRVDHTFVYERVDARAVEAPYRLKLVVQGDRLGELERSVQVPEGFRRRFREMRAANHTISNIAGLAIGLVLVFGCGGGVLWLARRRELSWRPALLAGAVMAALQSADALNRLPLEWMRYDTAESARQFLTGRALEAVLALVGAALLFAVVLMAAEGLSRLAFPKQPQLWKSWSPRAAASPEILGRTLAGYLLVPIDLAFVAALYLVARSGLGWWSPSSEPFHPDVLATYAPWLTPIASSLVAGAVEEALFRAVPIAGGALLGARFGRRRWGIAAGFVFQIVVFSAAHANYPGQPAYARLVELLIPSALFGALYLRYGLLPGVVLHFTFDVFWFALPVFAASLGDTFWSRAVIVMATLVPLWVVLVARLRAGKSASLGASFLNSAWKNPDSPARGGAESVRAPVAGGRNGGSPVRPALAAALVFSALAVGTGAWVYARKHHDSVPLGVSREEAIRVARDALGAQGASLGSEWTALVDVEPNNGSDSVFTWRAGGRELYRRLLGNYLEPPAWRVRFVRFGGKVEERAEEYEAFVVGEGIARRLRHRFAEAAPGKTLELAEARRLAREVIAKRWGIDVSSSGWKEITAEAQKRPARRDWTFAYASAEKLPSQGELRAGAVIAGDQIVGSRTSVFVPEAWERRWREEYKREGLVDSVLKLLRGALYLWMIVAAIRAYARRKFPVQGLGAVFAGLFALLAADAINDLPARQADFSTSEPLGQQWLRFAAGELVTSLVLALSGAVALGFSSGVAGSEARRARSWAALAAVGGAGALMAALQSAATLLVPRSWPATGSLAGAEQWWPALSALPWAVTVLGRSAFWIFVLDRAGHLTSGWTRRRAAGYAGLALVGFLLESGSVHAGVAGWFLHGVVGALTVPLLAWLVPAAGLASVPLFVGARVAMGALLQGAPPYYPGALLQACVGAAFALAVAGWMRKKVTLTFLKRDASSY